jgi:hypothetical protein
MASLQVPRVYQYAPPNPASAAAPAAADSGLPAVPCAVAHFGPAAWFLDGPAAPAGPAGAPGGHVDAASSSYKCRRLPGE